MFCILKKKIRNIFYYNVNHAKNLLGQELSVFAIFRDPSGMSSYNPWLLVILLVIHNDNKCSYSGDAYILSTLIINHAPPRELLLCIQDIYADISPFIGLLLFSLSVLSESVYYIFVTIVLFILSIYI